jgi:peptide/nickel transport system permease protein
MGIGSIIITEATLSFLGMGIKYPLASWGQIVSSATNTFVLSNYPLTWMPAGFLIFLTVLGFNFVGDGLRDAFDPKMKR